jgi:two-component system cell cycle sensor histidine kinase/response regulator CckA
MSAVRKIVRELADYLHDSSRRQLDGPSMLRELRKARPDLKIIFISGYAEDAFRKNLPEGETFHFLPKPFSLKQLAVAVKETLGR